MMQINQIQIFDTVEMNNNPHMLNGPYDQINSWYVTSTCATNIQSDICQTEVKKFSKRGRKSKYSEAERDQIRKFKKRNMERKRRAFIAQKMTELHQLSLQVVGEDPSKYQKMERADILSLCYDVMQGVSSILSDEPKLAEKIRMEVNCHVKNFTDTDIAASHNFEKQCMDDSGASMDESDSIIDVETIETPFYDIGKYDKENIPPYTVLRKDPTVPSAFRPIKCNVDVHHKQMNELTNVWRPYV